MTRPDFLSIRNGAKAPLTFSVQEMQRRVDALRAQLELMSLDAALFTSIHNVNYFADFVYTSFGRPYALVVSRDRHVTVSANIDYGQPWRQSFDDNIVYTDWRKDNFYRALGEVLPVRGRIGIEFDHVTIDVRCQLETFFPNTQWIDIAPATMQLRMIKSSEEHDIIRSGAAIADLGGYACLDALYDGAPEYEIARHATTVMVREIASRYPDTELMDTWTWLQSGLNTDGAHNPLTARRIQRGDVLSLNCFAMISGYYQALERTLFYDFAPPASLAVWEVLCEVHTRGCELIRPGARCMDIAGELNELLAAHGMLDYRTFGYGHSFGTLSHYYGREAGLELREDVATVLEPGMVISMEPMLTIPNGEPAAGGYREHDILIVTDSGAQNVTHFPYGPQTQHHPSTLGFGTVSGSCRKRSNCDGHGGNSHA